MAQLANNTEMVSIGTVLLGSCSHILLSVFGTLTLLAQFSATFVQLHPDFGSLCIKKLGTVMVCIISTKYGTGAGRGE